MSSEPVESPGWSATRWWALIGLVLVMQLGLIFWLGKPQRAGRSASTGESVPTLVLQESGLKERTATESLPDSGWAQLLALADPTLLALPHQQGFSGLAWLIFSPVHFEPLEQPEPGRWLELGEGQLGSEFKDFMTTNQFAALPSWQQQELALKVPEFRQAELQPAHSELSLAGGLASRRLLVWPELPAWPNADILTNSVVQLVVRADGTPFSAILLKPRGAPNQADEFALREARKLRFEPLNVADALDPMAGLTLGQLVFEWRTVPLPPTNNAAEATLPK